MQFARGKSGHSTEQASSHPISFYYAASILRMAVCNCFKGGIKTMKGLFFNNLQCLSVFPKFAQQWFSCKRKCAFDLSSKHRDQSQTPLFRIDRIWAEKLSSPAMIICSRLWKLFARCSSGYLCCFDPSNGSSGSLSLVIVGKTRFWIVWFLNKKTKKTENYWWLKS